MILAGNARFHEILLTALYFNRARSEGRYASGNYYRVIIRNENSLMRGKSISFLGDATRLKGQETRSFLAEGTADERRIQREKKGNARYFDNFEIDPFK